MSIAIILNRISDISKWENRERERETKRGKEENEGGEGRKRRERREGGKWMARLLLFRTIPFAFRVSTLDLWRIVTGRDWKIRIYVLQVLISDLSVFILVSDIFLFLFFFIFMR